MRYVLLVLLGIVALAAAALTLALWTRMTLILSYRDKTLIWTIRVLGLKWSGQSDTSELETDAEEETENAEKTAADDFTASFRADIESVRDETTLVDLEALKQVTKKYYDYFKTGKSIIVQFLGRLRYRFEITKLALTMNYGTGDPAQTGMAYGAVWGAVGILYPLLRRYFRIVYPTLDVTPDFQVKRFEMEAEGIIRIRPAHIINAAIMTVFANYSELKPFLAKLRGNQSPENEAA